MNTVATRNPNTISRRFVKTEFIKYFLRKSHERQTSVKRTYDEKAFIKRNHEEHSKYKLEFIKRQEERKKEIEEKTETEAEVKARELKAFQALINGYRQGNVIYYLYPYCRYRRYQAANKHLIEAIRRNQGEPRNRNGTSKCQT